MSTISERRCHHRHCDGHHLICANTRRCSQETHSHTFRFRPNHAGTGATRKPPPHPRMCARGRVRGSVHAQRSCIYVLHYGAICKAAPSPVALASSAHNFRANPVKISKAPASDGTGEVGRQLCACVCVCVFDRGHYKLKRHGHEHVAAYAPRRPSVFRCCPQRATRTRVANGGGGGGNFGRARVETHIERARARARTRCGFCIHKSAPCSPGFWRAF